MTDKANYVSKFPKEAALIGPSMEDEYWSTPFGPPLSTEDPVSLEHARLVSILLMMF